MLAGFQIIYLRILNWLIYPASTPQLMSFAILISMKRLLIKSLIELQS